MKILVFADVHYYSGDMETAIFKKTKKLVQYALPMLETLRDTVCAAYSPDFCVNLGDIIQDTRTHDGDVQSLAMMAEKLRAFPCPCFSLLGNHDMKMMRSRREAEEIFGLDCATFSMNRDGMHLVFLTSGLYPERGPERGGIIRTHEMTDEEIQWLRDDLAANTLPVLVFTHYPLAEDPSIADGGMFLKNRAAVKEILRQDANIRAVFSGHQHRTKTIVEDGIPYFVLGSMTASPEETGIPDGVYFCVDADVATVRVTTHQIQLQ